MGLAIFRAGVLGMPALLALAISTCRPAVHPGAAKFDPARAAATVEAMARACPERRPAGACSRRAVRIVLDGFSAAGLTPELSVFGARRDRANIVAVRRGRRGGEVMLVAHHDTVPGSPGALDDAAGVAVVLEVARALGRRRDGATMRFVVFDGEEDGLLGSRAALRARRRAGGRLPSAVVSVEMPGARGGAPVVHTFAPRPPPSAFLARLLSSARAADVDLGVGDRTWSVPVQLLVRIVRVPFGSDHTPYAAAGVPSVMLSDASLSSFYPHYHAATDLPDQLDRRALRRTGQAALAIVHDLAFGDRPPSAHGSREGLAIGTRVASGTALWVAALLSLLPLAGMVRRARPGGLCLTGLGAAGSLLLEPTLGLALLWPGLLLAPLIAAPRLVARITRAVALAPAVVTVLVWAFASARFGLLAPTLGVGRLCLLAAAVVGLATLRPKTPTA